MSTDAAPRIDAIEARAYTIPTDQPESDGTLAWHATTIVVVHARGGGRTGLGYTYAAPAAAGVVADKLADVVVGRDAMQTGAAWSAMLGAIRNLGQTGIAAMAVSAVDVALWDLKARLLDRAVVDVLDAVHDRIAIYGSGGFCSYTDEQLTDQLAGWVDQGIPRVKIKTGRDPERDRHRLDVARAAIGDATELFVDANGAFGPKQAVRWAEIYRGHDVRWFEEPVSSDDLAGLRFVREHAPAGLDVAAGEYGWSLPYFHHMLEAQAVDCLQVDVTRCGGISAFLRAGALCDARSMDLSAHCAPQLSAHAAAGVWHFRHVEYFHDHDRIERMLFDGCLDPQPGGVLCPDRSRPGLGLTLKDADAEQWQVA
jgi:L-alanine-DL-glutamate epimerase-like enolase superfamily enzyme